MDQSNLSSEEKLLLYYSRLSISDDLNHKIDEILSNELNWNFVLECSARQGISPLFYWNLKNTTHSKDVPPEIMEKLRKSYYNNLVRNMLLYNELGKVLKAFKTAGIETIVLKGAFLAEEIYKNIGLRTMSDIDLLIKKEDLQRAKKELSKLMYVATINLSTRMHEQFITVLKEELSFVNVAKKITIDVHWDIQPFKSHYQIEINEFWKNAKPVKISGYETLIFAPENLLQHLCLHLFKHINVSTAPPAKPLRDYCDIAEVTRHYKETTNWNYFLQSSKSYGIEEPIFQGLSIAKKHFGAFVPENILSKLEPVKSKIVFEEVLKGMAERYPLKTNQEHEDIYNTYIMKLRLVDGTYNKACILFGDAFPSKEYMIYRYSIRDKKQVYVYYLIRLYVSFLLGLDFLWKLSRYILRSNFSK